MSKRDTDIETWKGVCGKLAAQPPFTPGRGKILVCREPSEKETAGGIIIPEVGTTPSRKGIVIALGEKAINGMGGQIAFWVKVGDLLYFPAFIGTEVKLGEKLAYDLLFVNEADVIGKVN